ncbi:MAG: translation elongation factor Ts [Candidatus Magasanikbacteria bacterium]|nr:translation elongation factor Ts [Candidatus Magasanikbacteria bacterium]
MTTQDITKLREMTGAGMMDCKKALDESAGDMEKAVEILRKKGIIKAAKRGDKIAAEGLTAVKIEGNVAAIVEVNAETDFVAESDAFQDLVNLIVGTAIAEKPATVEEAMAKPGLQDKFNEAVAKIGEKLNLRRLQVITAEAGETIGSYLHLGGKISVLVKMIGGNDGLAKDIAMHIAGASPKYLNRESVDAAEINKEIEIASEQLRAQGKPENIIENIVKGKMDKFYSEVCLLEQPFVKDEEKTVGKLAEESGATIKGFWRYELGEGIEKKQCDFAAEVAEQLK